LVVLLPGRGELPRSPQAARLREAVEKLGMREVELPPLTNEESRQLIVTLLRPDHAQPESSIRRILMRAAAGFPMVLELLVQDWQANGTDSLAISLEAMTAEFVGRHEPHTAYPHILSRIVALLDTPTRNVLNLAAILGHRLNDLQMYDLLDVTPGQRIAGLSQLAELRVLRDHSGGLEFVNELMRAHAYARIPSTIRKALHSSVADRLLTGKDTDDVLGLEIAWHCTRAGRVDEATPHLLRGARQAIRHGAPHEAEIALSTALTHLRGPERAEATLLLAEVLQEQGCWQASLDLLNDLAIQETAEFREDALGLEVVARLNMSTASAELSLERLPELAYIVAHCGRTRTRIRASKAVAYLFERFRDRTMPQDLVEHIEAIPVVNVDSDSLGELGLAKAMLLYQAGNIRLSRYHALNALKILRERRSTNLVTVLLCSGLGALDSREGAYESAVLHLAEALRVAQSLGNDTMIATVTANLAICLGRLGKFDEQDALLDGRAEVHSPELTGFSEIQTAYARALGLALRGKRKQAIDAVSAVGPRLTGCVPAWMMQAWMLWKADVLLIAGRRQEALEAAYDALRTGGTAPRLWSSAFAGPFTRWIGICSHLQDRNEAVAIVESFAMRIDSYDAMDQAEIMCAKRILELRTGEVRDETLRLLRAKLDRLPQAVRSQLVAVEALPTC
jgi:tetratricopeptide (TPR) repeat protein